MWKLRVLYRSRNTKSSPWEYESCEIQFLDSQVYTPENTKLALRIQARYGTYQVEILKRSRYDAVTFAW